MVTPPGRDHVGDVGDAGAEDERQPGGLDRRAVRLRDHAGVGDDGDVTQPVGGHERCDDREHGGGLGFVAFERLDHQRETRGVGEHAEGDLWFQAAFLGESRLAEPVALVGLEGESRDVVEDQARWSQSRVLRARRGQGPPPGLGRIGRQPECERAIGDWLDADLGEYPQRVELGGRLDDAGEHQVTEDRVAARGVVEPECLVGAAERVPQVGHPR